jgi:hypothetical protein
MSKAECYSFHAGHNIYHETVDSFNQPRTQVDITHVMNNAFLVTANGVTEYWFHHMPHNIIAALTRSKLEGIEATEDKKFLFVYTGGVIKRFNMSQNKISNCFLEAESKQYSTMVAAVIKSIHEDNKKKLIERGISA